MNPLHHHQSLAGAASEASTRAQALKVVITYRRGAQPDEKVLAMLEERLGQAKHSVFIDRHLVMGVDWAREIEKRIRTSDAVIALLSAESVRSEMMGFEVEHAQEASQVRQGRPALLPVRVNYTGPLPEPIGGILSRIQYFLWEGPQDDEGLLAEIMNALAHLPEARAEQGGLPGKGQRLSGLPIVQPTPRADELHPREPAGPLASESFGGAAPLESEFYIARPVDGSLQEAITRRDSIILLKGARQMGKTSLLARGLHFARQQGFKVVATDFQKLNAVNLGKVENLYLTLAESLADQLNLPVLPSDVWDERRGPNANFERYLRREVLGKFNGSLVWGMDEVDRLFLCPFGSEVFGLFRSWHNERALDPSGPLSRLTLAIAYATEAHLFITDLNQSPFNVGTRLTLDDFHPLQVAELNRRHGRPLKDPEEVGLLVRLVGGHPYLVRRGLHEITTRRLGFATFESQAVRDEGFYGDHLRRLLVLLAKDPALVEVMRNLLRDVPCPTQESFYRLRSAGLVAGDSALNARPRCRLYSAFLRRHLQ